MIQIKSDKQIETMREGGKRLKYILDKTLERVRPGLSTFELDQFADDLIKKQEGEASFKRVDDYKWATCMCVDDCIVHGVPRNDVVLKGGDILTVDVGMFYKGLNTDTSWTVIVQDSKTPRSQNPNERKTDHFLEVGKKALNKAIKQVKVGKRVGHISEAIQDTIEKEGFSVSQELVGHGIGKILHEDPEIPGVLKRPIQKTPKLEIGMTLAIEAIYALGSEEVVVDEADGWTIRTKDGTIASCFEKTVALTDNGVVILT